jgi:hypothetical protein
MAHRCQHESPEVAYIPGFGRGETGAMLPCPSDATVGPWCDKHAPKSEEKNGPYTVEFSRYSSQAFESFAEALEFYSITLDKDPRLLGAGAEESDDSGDGGWDGLSDEERELVELADWAPARPVAAAPAGAKARREHDIAETVTAAPTQEALAESRRLSSLRTNIALISGALLGF